MLQAFHLFMATLDWKPGHHHLDMARKARPYLVLSGAVLPTHSYASFLFRLATAPWVSTKNHQAAGLLMAQQFLALGTQMTSSLPLPHSARQRRSYNLLFYPT
jgi:hypothetical protein